MRSPTDARVEAAVAEAVELLAPGVEYGSFKPTEVDWTDNSENWLVMLAREHVKRAHSIPPNLREVILARLDYKLLPRPRRGRRTVGEFAPRDYLIVKAIKQITRQGFKPTRNPASKRPCGCSIVAAALARVGVHMSESAITTIWDQRARVKAVIELFEAIEVLQKRTG
jgi:hypothetical protein